ncbi:aminomethyl-transferring glycine dehydrogenase subunit GcvPA [Verminephrobacter eiseniae]|uniref:aminomethyl-transferring glycine dehydrogenase subunit GcvPA n=1 Tax=Verminephrobacter eiseniae TaxID=364317 RepID=UPI002238D7B6|nr:aminomethyl-transferring glycine dehydrogenase subunit GcvPA [Verminephrobacter eiseniae]MCW5263010.1 aminomethyl-transferring glycine dehydrogenase subunit GcvPA [Verminephrobacter eiseniae]
MHPKTVYPYIPNSVPQVKAAMLAATGARSIDDFYADIPAALRAPRAMNLPAPLLSEARLKRHVQGLLARNRPCSEVLSFLGGGCYQHHVPAICDEINGRSEFLTAYAGEPYEDHGRFQALWEYCSMMGELLHLDVVGIPTYDGLQAAATACCMAARYTGRQRVLLAGNLSPDKRSHIRTYGRSTIVFDSFAFDAVTGSIDQSALAAQLGPDVAAVCIDNPNYFGAIEDGPALARLVHASGALLVVGVDPGSLGVLTAPGDYGADIVCGDIQTLGMHMNYGGGHGGFIATRDEPALVMQYPSRLFGIAPTEVPGQYGFGDVAYQRTSFDKRENGNEFVGTAAALWGITAGVYLASMGPQGMAELGEGILQRVAYARAQIAAIPGVRLAHPGSAHFKEFVVDFNATGRSVATINALLREHAIFGGHDLSGLFPQLGQAGLYAFTELHSQADIDTLVQTLARVTGP